MASHPSDELAQRRARRDGGNVVALDSGPVGVEHLRGRLTAAEREVAGLRTRLDHTIVERDHLARLADTRKRQRASAREREREVRDRLRDAERELADARERLVTRTASEAQLRVQSTGLHARIHALRAQAAGHDARVSALAALVEELQGTAGLAHAETEGHLAARERAERELTEAQASAAEFEEEVAALRTELDALHDARDRTLAADERARVARAAELEALRQSAERLRPPAGAAPAAAGRPGDAAGAPVPDLALELELAAERLRARVPEGAASGEMPREGAASPGGAALDKRPPAGARPHASHVAPVVAPPVPAIPTVVPAKAVARAALRRVLRGLRGGRR